MPDPIKVWVVYGCAGEYSDFMVWLLGVFSERQAADTCRAKAQLALQEFRNKVQAWEDRHESWEQSCPKAENNLGDHDDLLLRHPDSNYESVQYKVVELPLDQLDLLDPFRKRLNTW